MYGLHGIPEEMCLSAKIQIPSCLLPLVIPYSGYTFIENKPLTCLVNVSWVENVIPHDNENSKCWNSPYAPYLKVSKSIPHIQY